MAYYVATLCYLLVLLSYYRHSMSVIKQLSTYVHSTVSPSVYQLLYILLSLLTSFYD